MNLDPCALPDFMNVKVQEDKFEEMAGVQKNLSKNLYDVLKNKSRWGTFDDTEIMNMT